MQFNSLAFLAFIAVVLAIYFSLKHRAQNAFLLVASYFFYGYFDWRFLGLLFGSTLLVHVCAKSIGHSVDPTRRKTSLYVAIGVLLGVLGVFKYLDFFAASFAGLLAMFGAQLGWVGYNIVLPVGISFYTFQAIGYLLDVHRGRMQPIESFSECALFISFFPLLLAGPIERAGRLWPQIAQPRVVNLDKFTRGCYLILLGLVKKVVIADGLAKTLDPVFENAGGFGAADVMVVAYLYVLQIYCDFSGYSDVARGVARLLGFDVMKNFMTPFYAKSPSDYWARWHISLSSWVKDYIYLPLALRFMRAGGRLSEAKPHIYAMLLMGLWHGAAWTYIAWGMFHGLMLVLWSFRPKVLKPLRQRIPGWAWVVVYFHVTLASLLIFRAGSLSDLGGFLARLADLDSLALSIKRPAFSTLAAIPLFLLLDYLAFRHRTERYYRSWPPALRGALYACLFTLFLMGLSNAPVQFIYFQF